MLDRLVPGDVVTVTRIDRLARSTFDPFGIVKRIVDASAQFRSLAEPWADTGTSSGRLMMAVLGGLADVERDLIRTRTAEGRNRAKAQGKHMGCPLFPEHRPNRKRSPNHAPGATLQELVDSYGRSVSTMCRATRPPEPNPTAIVQRLWLCPQHLLNPQFLIISSCKFFLWLEMGQAKRRKEQFRKTPQTCALCGARPATTRDHVPPKALFPSPRPKLITVPACDICNESASEAEEKFRVYLSVKSGIDTPNSINFWKHGGLRTVRNNKKLLRELMSGTPLFIRSPSTGQFERTRTFKWPRSAHDPIAEKITRGLYYHHFGNPLPASAEIEVTFLNGLPDSVREFAMGQDLVRCNLGGDDRFCYAYARVEESPEFSIWIYQFYLRHWAGAITKPEGHDFDQNEVP